MFVQWKKTAELSSTFRQCQYCNIISLLLKFHVTRAAAIYLYTYNPSFWSFHRYSPQGKSHFVSVKKILLFCQSYIHFLNYNEQNDLADSHDNVCCCCNRACRLDFPEFTFWEYNKGRKSTCMGKLSSLTKYLSRALSLKVKNRYAVRTCGKPVKES
jgi:hypothetical protein